MFWVCGLSCATSRVEGGRQPSGYLPSSFLCSIRFIFPIVRKLFQNTEITFSRIILTIVISIAVIVVVVVVVVVVATAAA